jgi:hypothetical protein
LLNTPLEPTQSTLDGFTVLDPDLGQSFAPPFAHRMRASSAAADTIDSQLESNGTETGRAELLKSFRLRGLSTIRRISQYK